jgi:hypothetical protein
MSWRNIQENIFAPGESFVFRHTEILDYKESEFKRREALDYENIGLVSKQRLLKILPPRIYPASPSNSESHYRKAVTLFTEARSSKTG